MYPDSANALALIDDSIQQDAFVLECPQRVGTLDGLVALRNEESDAGRIGHD